MANGADAVYFGLSNFNARHRATNFTLAELPEVIDFLHRRNVRGYVTCNTLIFSDELAEIAGFVAAVAESGADAVIVQDLGLARLIARLTPGLSVHGSTQMTLTEPRAIDFVRGLGVERVILARELALADIERITEQTPMPVEVFVHGALCVAYSGQCLTSEALGGRSANRGQCAQACRLPYELIVDGRPRDLGDRAYLLSPQDLAAHELIGDLVRLGVTSLKIEGRLKSAQYVAAATKTYRAALDAALAGQPHELGRQERLDLRQSFSRGFTPGFLEGVDHQRLVNGRFPKSRGVRVGTVVGQTAQAVLVELAEEHRAQIESIPILKPGDGVVFDEGHPEQDEQGGRVASVKRSRARADRLEVTFAPGAVQLAALTRGSLVWRTDDPEFRRRMQRTYARDSAPRRVPVAAEVSGEIGGPLHVSFSDAEGNSARATWPGPLQAAHKHPLTAELLREQLGRLGDTPLELASVELHSPEPVMAPKSVLNDLRRQAAAALVARRSAGQSGRVVHAEALVELRGEVAARFAGWPSRPSLPSSKETASKAILQQDGVPPSETPSHSLYVLVRTAEQLQAVLDWSPGELPRPAMVYCDFEDVRRYREAVPLARAARLPIGLATLRILKPGEEGLLAKIAAAAADAVLVRNLGSLVWFRQQQAPAMLIGDYSLNAANELTADLLLQQGLARLVPSYDLTWEQLAAMLGRISPGPFEVVVHQQIPMFHMEHCVFAATLSNGKDWRDCGRPCDHHRVELRDRVGAEFPLLADTGCRNTVFNAVPQSAAEYVPRMLAAGLRHFRIELLREDRRQTQTLLTRYARLLAGLDDGKRAWHGLRILNQLGVTRGTLGG